MIINIILFKDDRYFNKIILGTCDFNKKEEMINIINNELNNK